MDTKELENFLAVKIAQKVIEKLANYEKSAAPKVMSNTARVAKPAAASSLGTKNNFMSNTANMASPTGKQVASNSLKPPTLSVPSVNDQLIAGTTLQSAGIHPVYPIVNNSVSQGGFGMMNQSN